MAAIKEITPIASLYFDRLRDGLTVRESLDSGKYPIDSYEGIPVHGEVKLGQAPGLYHGILLKIVSSYTMLKDLGYGKEAKGIIALSRHQK